ncbi:MAG: HD domain-containing protein [Candidatus Pacearchaeota archaeon]
MNLLDKTKDFVKKSFENSASGKSLEHFERTIYWAQQLNPKYDEAILIAAYSHDIARAFRDTDTIDTFKNKELNDLKILKEHQKGGADIMKQFLINEKANAKLVSRVYNMVLRHEIGGGDESNLIKDADSISYLEVNAPKHVKNLSPILGKDKVKRKIDWMFDRITSQQAKKLAMPFYSQAIELLK